MGGYGTWDAIARWPRYFAAAMPDLRRRRYGPGSEAQGPADLGVPWRPRPERCLPRRTTDMIDAIRKAGGTPKMTIYPGVEHDSWDPAYADPAVLDWLFGQKT